MDSARVKRTKMAFRSAFEVDTLLKLVMKNREIIESRKVNADIIIAKQETWKKITEEFNACSNVNKRTPIQLKKMYSNIKARRSSRKESRNSHKEDKDFKSIKVEKLNDVKNSLEERKRDVKNTEAESIEVEESTDGEKDSHDQDIISHPQICHLTSEADANRLQQDENAVVVEPVVTSVGTLCTPLPSRQEDLPITCPNIKQEYVPAYCTLLDSDNDSVLDDHLSDNELTIVSETHVGSQPPLSQRYLKELLKWKREEHRLQMECLHLKVTRENEEMEWLKRKHQMELKMHQMRMEIQQMKMEVQQMKMPQLQNFFEC